MKGLQNSWVAELSTLKPVMLPGDAGPVRARRNRQTPIDARATAPARSAAGCRFLPTRSPTPRTLQ